MNGDAVTHLRARVQQRVGMQGDVVPKLAVAADVVAAHQHTARAQTRSWADHAVGSDVRRRIELSRRIDDGAGMNSGGMRVRREEQRQQSRDGDARVGDFNQRLAL